MQGLTKKALTGLIWLQISIALMLFLARLDSPFLGGVDLLASLLGVVRRSHVAFPEA